MSSNNLPPELVEDILVGLPVKSLLRLRCVSKSWRALIDSPNFTKSHLSKNPKYYYLFHLEKEESNMDNTNLEIGQVDLINWCNRVLDSPHCPDGVIFENFRLPFSSPQDIKVLGACDGLIALGNPFYNSVETILVNPSTREYQVLPPIGKTALICDVGLGHDCFADEYKVVSIPSQGHAGKGVEVNVWGSKSNKWRQLHFSSNYMCSLSDDYGKYTHGALHWVEWIGFYPQGTKMFRIGSFDLATEKFIVTEYDGELFGYPTGVQLEVLRGCICVCCSHDYKVSDTDIWMMKEYGVKESWCKLVSFNMNVTPLALSVSVCGTSLLFKTHDNCLNSRFHIRWCNLDTKSKECLGTSAPYTLSSCLCSSLYSCPQSLVRLPGKVS